MYHRIAAEPFDPWGLAVEPQHFEEQIAWLAKIRTVLRLADFAALQRSGELPADAVAITFDDGYACTAETAVPVLERFGVPATIFLPATLIDKGDPFWWSELEELMLEHEGSTLTIDGQEVDIGPRQPADRQWKPGTPASTQRQRAFVDVLDRLQVKPEPEVQAAMRKIREQVGRANAPRPGRRSMSREQVRRTASDRIEFGSHALTHRKLPSLDQDEQRHEIVDSAERVSAMTGSRPAAFAYPYGMFDPVSEALAAEAGFACACTTRGFAVSRRSGQFALPRVTAGNWGAVDMERALARVRAE